MNHNRKRREAAARERRRREAALRDAVLVDPTTLVSCNSPVPPDFVRRGYYLDVPFTCASCGSDEVWTASQQKWWYEVAKGSLYSGAKLCRTCRRDARSHKGKAHPLQNIRRWLGLIRNDLDADLRAADWCPVIGVGDLYPDTLTYDRDDALARLRWECEAWSPALILERRDARNAPFKTLVHVDVSTYNMTHEELQRRFDGVLTAVRRELELATKLAHTEPDPSGS